LALFHVTPRNEMEQVLTAQAQAAGASLSFERPYRDYAQYAVLRLPAT
jgi:S-adenosylmethionine-diacylgycerolhomoserine-N-methlytransferase